MRLYNTRMNDSEYIEHLEELILELKAEVRAERKKFDDYINRQYEEQMANIGAVLSATTKAIEKE